MQAILAGVIVMWAALYALWRFCPASLRHDAARAIGRGLAGVGVSRTRTNRIEAKLGSAGQCGSCDSCPVCDTSEATRADSGRASDRTPIAPGAKVIPIARYERPRN